jgi:hypothetical protein
MRSVARMIALIGSLAAAPALAVPAHADSWEPTPPTVPYSGIASSTEKADAVVGRFQSSNYRVILNKIGTAPLDQCTVTSIAPGQAITTPVTGGAKAINQQVLFTTVYVTADCTKPASSASSSSSSGSP